MPSDDTGCNKNKRQNKMMRPLVLKSSKERPMTTPPFDDRDGLIWYDGGLVPWREARLHVLSHGLHYASAVFEGERAYNGSIFKLTEHSERLAASARLLGFRLPIGVGDLDEACRQVLEANGIVDGYVRPIAWRGSEMMAVSAQTTRIHLAIAAWPWPSYFSPESRLKGLRLKTAAWRRPPPDCAPVHAKATGLYMICTLSKHAVEAEGYDDALMLDWRGRIAEATGANIFMVMGIPVIERTIMPDELARATEVFLTGTAAEVTPVGAIDDHRFTVGEITQTLMGDYETATRTSPSARKAATAA
jgi:branched-chain amino acid aminotransferase